MVGEAALADTVDVGGEALRGDSRLTTAGVVGTILAPSLPPSLPPSLLFNTLALAIP